MAYRIGVDVGGTNTDAVIMDGRSLIASIKRPTSGDVLGGIINAIRSVLNRASDVKPSSIESVMIGTTHFTNAVVQRNGLSRTVVLRLCLPAGQAVPPLYDWPPELRDAVGARTFMLRGGFEFDGREISPLRDDEIDRVIAELDTWGIESVAVVGTFSPVSAEQEITVAERIRSALPDIAVTLSHEIGKIGILQRENAAALNACLAGLAERTISAFERSLVESGLGHARLFLSQNDGTLMSAAFARQYPVLTFTSGPTNSMRGAAFLSGVSDAIVLDVGGTTTDGGVLVNGFPRETSFEVEVGGVRTNFRMPDVLSIGIGGGSRVEDEGRRVGPRSVGHRLTSQSLVFGGETLTLTDVAVALGHARIGERSHVDGLDRDVAERALTVATATIEQLIDRLKTRRGDVPVVLVGGGADLFQTPLAGASEVVRPPNGGVANAIGAAIAQVSGEVDRVFSMDGRARQDVLDEAADEARRLAVEAGADPATIEVVEIDEIPLAYLPSNAVRVRTKVVGELRDGKR